MASPCGQVELFYGLCVSLMTIRTNHDFPGSRHSDLPVEVFTFSVVNFSSGSTLEGVNWYMMLSVNFGHPQCDVVLSNWNIAAFYCVACGRLYCSGLHWVDSARYLAGAQANYLWG